MKFKVIIHEAEEGGYWANVPRCPVASAKATRWRSWCQYPRSHRMLFG